MTEASTEANAPAQVAEDTTTDATDWKAEARKWEQRAKENRSAADELATIRDAQKSESEKAAERLAAAERAAQEAEAKVLRRDIALEFKLSKDDAALLDAITDENTLRQLAPRLAQQSEGSRPRPDPNQGRSDSALALNSDGLEAALRTKLGI